MDAVVSKILDAVPDIDPDVALEAYMRIVPVFTANIIMLSDESTGSYLTGMIFKQVADVEKVSGISGMLDHIVESTKTVIYSNYGIKKGETLELKGGRKKRAIVAASNTELSEVLDDNAQLIEKMKQKVALAQMEKDVAVAEAAKAKAKADRAMEEARGKAAEAQGEAWKKEAEAIARSAEAKGEAAKAKAEAETLVANAEAEEKKREATVYGQIDTPANRIIGGVSTLFSGAVLVFLYTAAQTTADTLVRFGAAGTGMIGEGGAQVVDAGVALAKAGGDATVSGVGWLGRKLVSAFTLGWVNLPTPEAAAETVAVAVDERTFVDKALGRSDGILSGVAKLGEFIFGAVSPTRAVVMALSLWVILTIVCCVLLKAGHIAVQVRAAALTDQQKTNLGNRLPDDSARFRAIIDQAYQQGVKQGQAALQGQAGVTPGVQRLENGVPASTESAPPPSARTADLLAELEGTPVSQQEVRGGRRAKLRTGKRRPKSERKRRATRRTPRFVY